MNNVYQFILQNIPKDLSRDLYLYFIFYVIYAIIEIYVFSTIISQIINYLKANKKVDQTYFKELIRGFILFLILYVIFLVIYRYFQNKSMIKIKTSVRNILLSLILKSNDNSYHEKSYIKYGTLINRFSEKLFWSLSNIIMYILPSIITICIVSFYLLYYDVKIFLFFIIINIGIIVSFMYKYNAFKEKSTIFENSVVNLESRQIEYLSNFDKIIFRGFSDIEINNYKNHCEEVKDNGLRYYFNVLSYETIILFVINITLFIIIYYFIYNKGGSHIVFIITLMLLYRSRIESCILKLSDTLEILTKLDLVQKNFDILLPNFYMKNNKQYNKTYLPYDKIEFKNIKFKYTSTDRPVFKNFNINFDLEKNKLIGLYGHSGSGKSTLCKLLLKIYNLDNGKILINGVNIDNLDNASLKKNITYINQNNKLFDNNVEYNLKYGCTTPEMCSQHLEEVIHNKNLKNIFHKNDLEEIKKIKTGFLGEKISGGQRQVVNVLNGLIYPSKLLILDEPTSNLDYESKKELIEIIKKFKKYKTGIIIITHDKDLLNIFDRTINMDKIDK